VGLREEQTIIRAGHNSRIGRLINRRSVIGTKLGKTDYLTVMTGLMELMAREGFYNVIAADLKAGHSHYWGLEGREHTAQVSGQLSHFFCHRTAAATLSTVRAAGSRQQDPSRSGRSSKAFRQEELFGVDRVAQHVTGKQARHQHRGATDQ
jgi:hypothetical protein